IGPFTSIGMGTIIEGSSLEYSVILDKSHIYHIERLADSLLGKGVEVKKEEGHSQTIRLFVGDDAKVEL
ncbi:glucose-1-phosphate thymidylyltransferase, partial [Chloroflexota bacterium]